jgi:Flp pilus assembly protein TadB
MRKEIDETLQSYMDLLKRIEEISKKFKSAQDTVQFKKYLILAQVAAVAAGVVIVGVCVAPTFALPAAFFYDVVGLFAFGMFYLAYIAWRELKRTNDRLEETRVLLKRLGDKDIERVRSGVNFTRSAIIDLGNILGQVETRIDIAEHYVRGQDAMNQAGDKLIEYCEKMEKKSEALQEQIEILRTDVHKVQQSRYPYR